MNICRTTSQELSAGKHILLVEDNLLNQKLTVLMLQRLGHRVDVANDGYDALQQLAQNCYDLIIMDCVMPNMNGYQASQKIRHIERMTKADHVPIIAVTANMDNGEEKSRCIEAGMDDFLTKPVDMSILQRMVEKWTAEQTLNAQDNCASDVDSQTVIHDVAGIRESLGDQYAELVKIYLSDAEKLVARLRQAVACRDMQEIVTAAHTLRGSSRYVGAQQVAELCTALQASAHDTVNSQQLLLELEHQFGLAQQVLSASVLP